METKNDEPQYAKSYKIGNTTINIVAPNITAEENERRWKHTCDIARMIVERMIEEGRWSRDFNDVER